VIVDGSGSTVSPATSFHPATELNVMTDTPMVIVPARGLPDDMWEAGEAAISESFSMKYGNGMAARKVYKAMLAASPASGKVTEEQVEKMAEAIYVAHEIMEGFTEEQALFALKNAQVLRNMLRDYTPIARAALASIGLECE
jgi:hypothetical protein